MRRENACGRTGNSEGVYFELSRRSPVDRAADWVVEQLERRILLSAGSGTSGRPLFYLDVDGARAVTYGGPVSIDDLSVPAFSTPNSLGGDESAMLKATLRALRGESADVGRFTLRRPTHRAYSTIYVGGNGADFSRLGSYWGLAEKVDTGNTDPSDDALVFSDAIAASSPTPNVYVHQLARVIAHEAGHLVGRAHVGDTDGDHNGTAADPLADVAFDPKVHVDIGKDAMADALDDGKVTIGGHAYAVHPKILAALQNYPSYYNAGAVGPDGFPDSIMGQFVIHAEDHGTWVGRVLDMAWAAQADPTYTPTEQSQILAFAYGYITHSTGDHWAHTLVNEFAEGTAPGFIKAATSVPRDQRDLANMLRHFMTEAYIADALQGVDKNPDRTLLSDGDVSDDSTPGINYDAPVRFIYETLIRPFPDDPTKLVEVDWDGGGLAAVNALGVNAFVRAAASIGGGLSGLIGDDVKPGMILTVAGFSDPANNGNFRVTAVDPDSTLGNVLATTISVDRPLVPEIADGDETIVVHVPKTAKTKIDVNPTAGTFTRATGSFVADGFVPGMRFSGFGFTTNFDNFIAKSVTPTVLTVVGQLAPGDEVGSGDEQLVVQGDRGPILNTFFRLRDKLYTKAVERDPTGSIRAVDFGTRISQMVDHIVKGQSIGSLDDLLTSYLYNWADAIDDGVRHWGEFGQAFTRAMFDPQSRRNTQNKIGAEFGADTLANTARGDAEDKVGFLDTLLNQLDDPDGDGSLTDSFINNHLLAMAGLPPQLGILRTAVESFNTFLDGILGGDNQVEGESASFNPTTATPETAKAHKAGFIKSLFKNRFNIDFDTFQVLHDIHAKMDLKSITIEGKTIPIFKPDDHGRMDAYLGLGANHHTGTVDTAIPGVEFYPNPEGALDDSAHFDKNSFAAYKNAVTLTKMAYLMETPPDGSASGAGQLSALFKDLSGAASYDATKLNLNGAHGGNVLTATFPGAGDGGSWLKSIDADHVWRADSRTTTTALFRVSTQNDTASPAEWKASVPSGQYKVYATWQANVTQDFDNLDHSEFPDQKLSPATNAQYTVFDGSTAFAAVTKDQRQFPSQFATDTTFNGFGFTEIGTYTVSSGTLRVQLSNVANGHVIAGPILVEPVAGGSKFLIQNLRDPQTLAPLPPSDDYADSPSSWTDLAYRTGGGNDPLWESALLRPGFRTVFTDWQDGSQQFPDLGDTTSPDPNTTPIAKAEHGSYGTPTGPAFRNTTLSIPITDAVKAFILDGLNNVVGFAHTVEGLPPLGVTIPGLGKSIADVLNLSGKVDDAVRKPIVDYFTSDATPTFQELFTAVGPVMGGSLDSISSVLEFNVDLRKTFTTAVELSLGSQADAVGLKLTGTVDADAAVKFVDAAVADLPKLTFGLDLTPDTTVNLGDRVYVRADRAILSADVNASNVNLGANFGIVKAGIVGGTVNLSADAELSFVDPNSDGKITLREIAMTPLSSLVHVTTATGTLNGNLPVHIDAGIGGISNLDVGTLVFGATNLFDPSTYTLNFNGNFDQLFDLSHISFDDVLAALDKVVGYLQKLNQFSFLSTKLPIINKSVADLVDVAGSLATDINNLRADPAGSLQAVEAKIEQIFGLGPSAVTLSLDATHALKLSLALGSSFSSDLTFDFDITALPGLPDAIKSAFSLTGSGTVHVEGGAALGLDLGLDLTDPTSPKPFLYDSSTTSFTAGVSTPTPLDFSVTVLGLGAAINDATFSLHKKGDASQDAKLTAQLVDPSDHRLDFDELASLSASNVNLTFDGAADLTLPFEFPPGTPLPPPLDIDITDLQALFTGDASVVHVNSFPDFSSILGNLDLSGDLSSLLASLDQLLALLQAGMNSGAFARSIPMIGDKLKDGANVIDHFRTDFLAKIQPFVSGGSPKTLDTVKQALFDALGNGPNGLGLLQDFNGNGTVGPEDVDLFVDNVADPSDVRFNVHIVRAPQTVKLPTDFDIGLPALGLKAEGEVDIDASLDLNIGFGINKTSGPYLYVGNANELKVGVDVTIPNLKVQGNLAFLQVNVKDDPANPSSFTADFGFDLTSANPNGEMSLGELAGAAFNASLDANAVADVNLKLDASFGGSAKFPRLLADLNLDWAFGNANTGGGGAFGSVPHVAFNDVNLDLGTFFSNFVSPIVDKIRDVLKPIQPVLDVLDTRVPVLSDIGPLKSKFDTNHDGKVSLLEAIDKLSSSPALKFIAAVKGVSDLVNKIPTGLGANVLLPLGGFDLGSTDPRSLTTLANLDESALNEAGKTLSEIKGALDQIGVDLGNSKIGGFLDNIGGLAGGAPGSSGFKMPILDSPSSAFKLLLGQDVNLFTFDMPPLAASFHMDEFFPLFGPLGVRLKGDFGVNADFAFGYDTKGVREFVSSHNGLDLFDGFYVSDTENADGTFGPHGDVPEITLDANIFAAAELNAVVVSVGVGGGIFTDDPATPEHEHINLDLFDPNQDGKVRVKEIAQDLSFGPLCLFDTTGKLTAALNAYVKVGVDIPFVGFVGWSKTKNIASTTLVDLTHHCDRTAPQPDPVLATHIGGGVLRLNMGPFADQRLYEDTDDDDENFTVTPGGAAGQVNVSAFGRTQTFNNISKIYAEGGQGSDTVTLSGLTQTSELYGDFKTGGSNPGNDHLFAGDGAAVLFGGGGDDQLTLGSGGGEAHGQLGNDLLFGASGVDRLDGGPDLDQIEGGDGNDDVSGGPGDDVLHGDGGNDTVSGNDGDDTIEGGDGNDTVDGGTGTDVIEGDAGDDTLKGLDGVDLIAGDEADINVTAITGSGGALNVAGAVTFGPGTGNDTILGGNDGDAIFGQGGNDTLSGEAGADYIEGDGGNDSIDGGTEGDRLIGGNTVAAADGSDTMTGGTGDDVMLGDNGSISAAGVVTLLGGGGAGDVMHGNDGNDRMFGEAGNDTMTGDAGADSMDGGNDDDIMTGGTEDDVMTGGAGNDNMQGEAGADKMSGDDGNDTMNGNDGADQMLGGNDNDVMSGDAGPDYMEGNAGNDQMTGGDGNDRMLGGTGDDTMSGDAGEDVMQGDDGKDRMTGGTENDVMAGNADDDNMSGNDGDDEMTGGGGNDTMTGDAGHDVMLGDDGVITRLTNSAGAPLLNFNGSQKKTVVLTNPAAGGADGMSGGAGDDLMFGGAADDTLSADDGDDDAEGNNGADTITGGNGEDDLVGGSSDRSVPAPADRAGDGADNIDGGADADVIAGDNATITRRLNSTATAFARYTPGVPQVGTGVGPENNATIRDVTLLELDTVGGGDTLAGGTGDDIVLAGLGNDLVTGGDGNDDLTGHLGDDTIDGGAGSDGILGDKGTIVTDKLDASKQTTIESNGNKTSSMVYVSGTLERYVTLSDPSLGGNDTIRGGQGDDFIHAGAGNDIVNGDDAALATAGGNDALFGDLGNDVMVGGAGTDHLWGGSGDDNLDGQTGNDTAYGGDGQDRLVADVKDDRLIDWFGNFNDFVVPGPGYGEPTIIRSPNPHMRDYLTLLATADGATNPEGEAAIVTPPSPENSGPGPKR